MSDQDRISPYNINTIKQTRDENKEKCQLKTKFSKTNIIRTLQQTVRRITNEILEVKELSQM